MSNIPSDTNTLQLLAELAALKAQTEALKAAVSGANKAVSIKVSEKGAVSVYGLGRFPVTLYAEQWAKLADTMPAIEAFIADNKSRLSTKADKLIADEAKKAAEAKARVESFATGGAAHRID